MNDHTTIPEFATPAHITTAIAELERRVGSKDADVYCNINKRGFSASLYPNGITNRPHLLSSAPSWDAAFAELHTKWAEYQVEHVAEIVRRMALKIIEVTAERGECRDSDLRMKFAQVAIDEHSDAAVERANEMAGNGPFSIVKQRGANAA